MNTVPVLKRNVVTGDFEPVECNYKGAIPRKVWRRLNREFMKLHAARYFYPCDAADAYHHAVREMEQTASRYERGDVVLKKSSIETYLSRTAFLALKSYHSRMVVPVRAEYRQEDEMIRTAEEAAETEVILTTWDLGEALAGESDWTARRDRARRLLAEICAKLSDEVVVAFQAYVAADGNMLEAAHLARMSRTDFYRKWPGYLALARKAVMSDK